MATWVSWQIGLELLLLPLQDGNAAQRGCCQGRTQRQAGAESPPEVSAKAGCFREGGEGERRE